MKIKLCVSGGLIPVYKESEIEATIADKELNELIAAIEIKGPQNSKARDSKYYTLEINGKSIPVNPDSIPKQHEELFIKLINNLKRVDQ
jgi:hypothetical protein